MTATLSEDQVIAIVTKAIGHAAQRRDKILRFAQWKLTQVAALRIEFAGETLLIQESPYQRLSRARRGKDRKHIFSVELSHPDAAKKIADAVKSLMTR
jgi:hypothetical protein